MFRRYQYCHRLLIPCIDRHDGILLKQNNYSFYDWAGPRAYFPWDLDSTMSNEYDVFTGTVPGGTTLFTDALFTNWEDDYDARLTELLAGPLSVGHPQACQALFDEFGSGDVDDLVDRRLTRFGMRAARTPGGGIGWRFC